MTTEAPVTKKPKKSIADTPFYKSIVEKLSTSKVVMAEKSLNVCTVEEKVSLVVAADGNWEVVSGYGSETAAVIYKGSSMKTACYKFMKA